MWISRKKYNELERRISKLEEKVEDNNFYNYYTEENLFSFFVPPYRIKVKELLRLILEYLSISITGPQETRTDPPKLVSKTKVTNHG